MKKEFVRNHSEEIAEALEDFFEFLGEGFETLKSHALDGTCEVNEVMQYCMMNASQPSDIPFMSGRTTQMLYDVRSFFEHCQKLAVLFEKSEDEH